MFSEVANISYDLLWKRWKEISNEPLTDSTVTNETIWERNTELGTDKWLKVMSIFNLSRFWHDCGRKLKSFEKWIGYSTVHGTLFVNKLRMCRAQHNNFSALVFEYHCISTSFSAPNCVSLIIRRCALNTLSLNALSFFLLVWIFADMFIKCSQILYLLVPRAESNFFVHAQLLALLAQNLSQEAKIDLTANALLGWARTIRKEEIMHPKR